MQWQYRIKITSCKPCLGAWKIAGAVLRDTSCCQCPDCGFPGGSRTLLVCGVGITFGVIGSAARSAEPVAVYLGRAPGPSPKEIGVVEIEVLLGYGRSGSCNRRNKCKERSCRRGKYESQVSLCWLRSRPSTWWFFFFSFSICWQFIVFDMMWIPVLCWNLHPAGLWSVTNSCWKCWTWSSKLDTSHCFWFVLETCIQTYSTHVPQLGGGWLWRNCLAKFLTSAHAVMHTNPPVIKGKAKVVW